MVFDIVCELTPEIGGHAKPSSELRCVHAAWQQTNKTACFRIVISVSGTIGVLLKPLIPPMSKRLIMRSGEKHKQEKCRGCDPDQSGTIRLK